MMRGSVRTGNASSHTFARAPQAGIPRAKFNRTFGVKTTFNEGYLTPILVDEMLPGDTFALKMHAFARVSTMIFPIMDNMYMETFFFFVPNRLLWTNWEKFCGYQVNPGDSVSFTIPQQTVTPATGYTEGSLADYFGLPTKFPGITKPNALHFRAYNLIYNDWFRDENLQNSVTVDLGNGPDTASNYVLLRRGKRRDYFTSCLPFPQKGPAVTLPLGTQAPIRSNLPDGGTPARTNVVWYDVSAAANAGYSIANQPAELIASAPNAGAFASWGRDGTNYPTSGDQYWNYADLSAATASTVNDLRLAFQTQKYYEKQARGGTRYTEVIKSHFDVTSPDMRLQRPEYIGGGSTPILINPVAATAASDTATTPDRPLADLGAYGVCAPEGHGFTYSATEHGVVLGLVMVRADLNYQEGMDRMWTRQTFTDYYWPVFSHLGEQAVLAQEICAIGTSNDTTVFGYQERYAEYRYKPSLITGLFRSNATGSLDSWHLAQDFAGTPPTLSASFIVENAPMDRIKAVTGSYDFIFDAQFSYHCARPMPVYSVPGLIDHF